MCMGHLCASRCHVSECAIWSRAPANTCLVWHMPRDTYHVACASRAAQVSLFRQPVCLPATVTLLKQVRPLLSHDPLRLPLQNCSAAGAGVRARVWPVQ